MRARISSFILVLTIVGSAALFPVRAHADALVVVLGLASFEGDDEFAQNLTGAIRHEVSQVAGWRLSDRDVTLAQMLLAHGCSDDPDSACLLQIATTLNVQRIVYGSIQRESGDRFLVTLSLYNAQTAQTERTIEERLSNRLTDIDDLRRSARELAARLSGIETRPTTGSLSIESGTPRATVRVNGEIFGATDASGQLTLRLREGTHQVQVDAEGHEPWSEQVTIVAGSESSLTRPEAFSPYEEGSPRGGPVRAPSRSGDGPSIYWPGIVLLAVGVISFGGAIYSWARLDAINSDPGYQAYTQAFRSYYLPEGTNPLPNGYASNCGRAALGETLGGTVTEADARYVSGLCDEGSTLEILQYVFVGVAAAATAAGVVLWVVDGSGDSHEEPAVSLMPSFGTDGASLRLRMRF